MIEQCVINQKQECDNCRFFLKSNYYREGECRRRSPKVVLLPLSPEAQTKFPKVNENYWCGDWESKPEQTISNMVVTMIKPEDLKTLKCDNVRVRLIGADKDGNYKEIPLEKLIGTDHSKVPPDPNSVDAFLLCSTRAPEIKIRIPLKEISDMNHWQGGGDNLFIYPIIFVYDLSWFLKTWDDYVKACTHFGRDPKAIPPGHHTPWT